MSYLAKDVARALDLAALDHWSCCPNPRCLELNRAGDLVLFGVRLPARRGAEEAVSYMERRVKLANLMAQAADVIRQEPDPRSRALLIERCAAELQECLENGASYSPGVLADCFVESIDRFIEKVAAPQSLDAWRTPHLRVVE